MFAALCRLIIIVAEASGPSRTGRVRQVRTRAFVELQQLIVLTMTVRPVLAPCKSRAVASRKGCLGFRLQTLEQTGMQTIRFIISGGIRLVASTAILEPALKCGGGSASVLRAMIEGVP